jgi:uncharacterized coiled-coil protein SlyX
VKQSCRFDLSPSITRQTPRAPAIWFDCRRSRKGEPALVPTDKEGKPYTVRYDAVNAMLLNEFLKEHRKVEEQEASITQLKSTVAKQEATIAQQQRGMDAVRARLKEQAAQILAHMKTTILPSTNSMNRSLCQRRPRNGS